MLRTIDFDSLTPGESVRCNYILYRPPKGQTSIWRCVLAARHMDGDRRHVFGRMGSRKTDDEWWVTGVVVVELLDENASWLKNADPDWDFYSLVGGMGKPKRYSDPVVNRMGV